MIIPPRNLAFQLNKKTSLEGVFLKSSHLYLSKKVIEMWKEEVSNLFLCYYPEKKQLLLAPVSKAFFPKLHKSTQHLLKERNLLGDKSLALHELLIDHELQQEDRTLEFEFMDKYGILKIYI